MGDGQRQAPASLLPGKGPGTHCTGGWVGPTTGLDECRKSRPPRFDLRTVQPVASRYTDYTSPAHIVFTAICIYEKDPSYVAFETNEETNVGQHETAHKHAYNHGNL